MKIKILNIPEDKPKGWDSADAIIEENFSAINVLNFIKENLTDLPENLPEPPEKRQERVNKPDLNSANKKIEPAFLRAEILGVNDEHMFFKLPDGSTGKVKKDTFNQFYLSAIDDKYDWGAMFSSLDEAVQMIEKVSEQKHYTPNGQEIELTPAPFNIYNIPLDDGTISRAVLRKYTGNIRYDYEQRKFFIWTGKYWSDEQSLIYRLIKSLLSDAERLLNATFEPDLRDKIGKLIKKLNTSASLESIVKYIQTEKDVADKQTSFNQQLYKICCPKGTIDLKTGELTSHNKSDKFSLVMQVSPEKTETPKWNNFLLEMMSGDQAKVDFLQRFLGYCLTGDTSERIMLFLVGPTTNGKGVFTRVLGHIFGDYAIKAASDLLMQRDGNHIPNDLAALVNKRLVICSESEAHQRLAEAKVKDMTGGGDPIQARFLFREYFTFVLMAKIILVTNYPPRVTAGDRALWRRIRVIKCDYEVPPEKVNPRLTDELKAEAPGILSWMVAGCLEWQRQGLNCPESIMEATREYQGEMDIVGHWIEENCLTGSTYETSNDDLYHDYEVWAKQNGHRPMSKNSLGRELGQKGFEPGKKAGVRTRRGIALGGVAGF